jgi:hypothetical protein
MWAADMSRATFFRTKKDANNPFVMIDKRPLENRELSWKAKGMLAYLLSRPEGWEIWVEDLINRSTDGTAAVRAGLRELKDAGHLKFIGREINEFKQFKKAVWEVYEVPVHVTPDSENQHQAANEKRRHSKKKLNKNNLNNINMGAKIKENVKSAIFAGNGHASKAVKHNDKLKDMPLAWKVTHGQDISQQDLENEKAQVRYPFRQEFPPALVVFADAYVDATGQKPKKRSLLEWLKVFQEWCEDGYTPEMVCTAYKMSRPNKKPWRSGFSVSEPRALSKTLNELQGLLAKGTPPQFDDEQPAEEEPEKFWPDPV